MFTIRWLLITLSLFLPISFFAQDKSILGRVIDADSREPLEFVNVVLLNVDSTFIDGVTTNESGSFLINSSSCEKAILKISFIGYKIFYIDLNLDKSDINIEECSLMKNAQNLNEVIITASPPQYKLKNGNLITNVENTHLSSIGNANDVIGQIPGVSVDEENNVNVFGKGRPIIYVNNRKLYDLNELNQLQSLDIASIEVLRNPGAKYDAQSQSVIIIKTKTKTDGFSVNTSSRTWLKKHIETSDGLDLSYSTNKLNVFLSYYYAYWNEGVTNSAIQTVFSDTLWSQSTGISAIYQNNSHNVTIGADYSITDKYILGIEYRGTFSRRRDSSNGIGDFHIDNVIQENIISKTLKKENVNNHLLNFFSDNSFSDKFNLRFDMDYMGKTTPSDQLIYENSSIPGNNTSIIIGSKASFDLLATKLIVTYKLGNDSQLEIGLEYSNINGDGFYVNNGNLSHSYNIYENREQRTAASTGYKTIIKGWEIGLGLRYEYSHEKIAEDLIKTVKTNRYYNNIYPNLTLSKRIGDISIGLNGNIRTRRPSFSQLNSSDIYVNRFLTQRGNSYLQKEDYYEISSSALYKMFSVNIGYSYIKNPISFNMVQNGSSEANSSLTFINYNRAQQISFLTSFSPKIDFWQPRLSVGIIKPFFSSIYKNKIENYNNINFSANLSNDFILPNDLILSLYFRYQNDYYSYSTKWKGYAVFSMQLRKSFLKNKLRTNLYINDLFNSKKERNEIEVNNYNFIVSKKNETQYISLSIQFLFNTTNKKYRGRSISDNDIDRL